MRQTVRILFATSVLLLVPMAGVGLRTQELTFPTRSTTKRRHHLGRDPSHPKAFGRACFHVLRVFFAAWATWRIQSRRRWIFPGVNSSCA